jgi:glycosyltransferase involved in cell wall biosynthesis
MKKILYLGNKLSKIGINPSTIETLSLQLESEGFKLIAVSSLQNKVFRLFHMWFSILTHFRKVDFVLIDTYSSLNFWYAYSSSALCRILKLPYLPILHGGSLPERFKKNPKQASFIVNNAFKTVIPSAYLEFHLRNYNIPRAFIIPNTIEIKNYPFTERDQIKPNLLWVRAIDSTYNPEMALKVLELISEQYPSAKLTMVGPFKDISELQWKKIEEKYKVKPTLTGRLSKEQWIKLSSDFDIFLNTTNVDNMPVSVIEAMALGLPIISTNVGGLPFLLENNENALLVESNNEVQMAETVFRLLENKGLAHKLSLNARNKVEQFDWEIVKNQWKEILK